jgi:hypothetical protein
MKNDITGDEIKSRIPSREYLDNYDRIFRNGSKKEKEGRHQAHEVEGEATETEDSKA